jgi:hypothetical protein
LPLPFTTSLGRSVTAWFRDIRIASLPIGGTAGAVHGSGGDLGQLPKRI